MKFGFEDEKIILSALILGKNLTIFIQNLFNFIQK